MYFRCSFAPNFMGAGVYSIGFSYLVSINIPHLVSGATYFIGSHLIFNFMKNDSNSVVCDDIFDNILIKNIHKWLDNLRFKLLMQSLFSPLIFRERRIGNLPVMTLLQDFCQFLCTLQDL